MVLAAPSVQALHSLPRDHQAHRPPPNLAVEVAAAVQVYLLSSKLSLVGSLVALLASPSSCLFCLPSCAGIAIASRPVASCLSNLLNAILGWEVLVIITPCRNAAQVFH
jgi:hypothetical protein